MFILVGKATGCNPWKEKRKRKVQPNINSGSCFSLEE